jgi:hypothetical protein
MRMYKSVLQALGRKSLPWPQDLLLRGIGRLGELIDDRLHGADAVAGQVRKRAERFAQERRERAARASDQAARDGFVLWELWRHRELVPWRETLAHCGISRSTARNLMNLAAFSHQYPEIYAKLRTLGPTKLYRLCRQPLKALEKLDLEKTVPTPRGETLLVQMSDKEFAAYLRTQVLGVKPASPVDRARARIFGLHRMIENAPNLGRAERGSWRDIVGLMHREAQLINEQLRR